jgi:hypothetical protein
MNHNTEARVFENAAVVRDAIVQSFRNGRRRVVVIAHSKGGLEASAALSIYGQESYGGVALRDMVRLLVTLQSPYGGSPIATDIVACPKVEALVTALSKVIHNADERAVRELTYHARQAFTQQHPHPEDFPTISVTSHRTPDGASVLTPTIRYMLEEYGLPSDGLVAQVDGALPGSLEVRIPDLDHNDMGYVSIPGLQKKHPGDIIEAVLAAGLAATR